MLQRGKGNDDCAWLSSASVKAPCSLSTQLNALATTPYRLHQKRGKSALNLGGLGGVPSWNRHHVYPTSTPCSFHRHRYLQTPLVLRAIFYPTPLVAFRILNGFLLIKSIFKSISSTHIILSSQIDHSFHMLENSTTRSDRPATCRRCYFLTDRLSTFIYGKNVSSKSN